MKGMVLLVNFEEAALAWGWEADQGHDDENIEKACQRYCEAREVLRQYIKELENARGSI